MGVSVGKILKLACSSSVVLIQVVMMEMVVHVVIWRGGMQPELFCCHIIKPDLVGSSGFLYEASL